jgi:CxxC-x17-CxxC domain-containing protein
MTDKDKTVIKEPIEELKVDNKPVEEPKAEEPKNEEVDSVKAASTDDVVTSAGTDQQGRQLYSVKCANCGKQTEVPFKPSGDRPVYCRDCYMQKKGGI